MDVRTGSRRAAEYGGRTPLEWTAVGLALTLAGINGYVAVATGETPFAAVALTFVLGLVLFFSSLWRSILYVAAAVHVAALGVVWLLDGLRFPILGGATGVLSLLFLAAVVRLFVGETTEE
jgi:hypothetical protein